MKVLLFVVFICICLGFVSLQELEPKELQYGLNEVEIQRQEDKIEQFLRQKRQSQGQEDGSRQRRQRLQQEERRRQQNLQYQRKQNAATASIIG